MRERDVESYLVRRVKEMGGEVRKVQWVGRNGAPDRLVMLPWRARVGSPLRSMLSPRHIWVELKAPGEKAKPHQLREHERLRAFGFHVAVVDSLEGVDAVLLEGWTDA